MAHIFRSGFTLSSERTWRLVDVDTGSAYGVVSDDGKSDWTRLYDEYWIKLDDSRSSTGVDGKKHAALLDDFSKVSAELERLKGPTFDLDEFLDRPDPPPDDVSVG